MKHLAKIAFISILLWTATSAIAEEESLQFGPFGKVFLYRQSDHPSHVALFVSGDGGWNLGVVDMARTLPEQDALVVGIDITHYLRELAKMDEACSYPAGDFEMLSKYVQRKLVFPRYVPPVLIGYSSGATLVYAILAQAPANTFQGAISLGFCPDLTLSRPLCRGYGLEWRLGQKGKATVFLPARHLQAPWVALQGTIDQVCDPANTEAFVRQVSGGEIVVLPKVGHGFAVQRNWMPQFKKVFLGLVAKQREESYPEPGGLADLPIIEVPAPDPNPDVFAVILSGDGGWAGIDRDLGRALAGKGISVVGLNSLQYFWKHRSPEQAGKDLGRILSYYLSHWNQKEAFVVGYSLGADVLPFMINRLDPAMRDRVRAAVLLGPSERVSFEFHLKDWLGGSSSTDALPVLPEVEKLGNMKMLCFCGEKEGDSLCQKLDPHLAKIFVLPGAHHFGGNYDLIAEAIVREVKGRHEAAGNAQ
jgi:type IV secretory pathway VirJ component